MEYWLLFQNCQKFAKEILICLTGDKKILQKSPVDAGTSVGFLAAIAGVVAAFAIGSKVLSSNQCEDQNSDEDDWIKMDFVINQYNWIFLQENEI